MFLDQMTNDEMTLPIESNFLIGIIFSFANLN
jgi:hypothetical protein